MKDRMTIIAIPGAGMNAGVWGDLAAHLGEFHFDALSLPGHGASPDDLPLRTLEEMTAFLRRKLDGRAGNPVVLLGHSMGALLAMEAAGHPAVAGIALLGAARRMPVHPDLLAAAKDSPEKAREMIVKWGVSRAHPRAEALRARLLGLMAEPLPEALYWDLRACNDYAGPSATRKPALVLAGEDDKLTSAPEGQALAEALDAAYVAFPACGHMIMVEKPAETAAEISRFVRGING